MFFNSLKDCENKWRVRHCFDKINGGTVLFYVKLFFFRILVAEYKHLYVYDPTRCNYNPSKANLNVYHCMLVFNKETSSPEKLTHRWIESVKTDKCEDCGDYADEACPEFGFDSSSSDYDEISSSDYSSNSRCYFT